MKNGQLKLVVLEDNVHDIDLVKLYINELEFDCKLRITHKKSDYREHLDTFKPDIILADYNMPTFDGMTALQMLRENDSITPFIFVTGTLGEEYAVSAIKNGATDFIPKDRLEHLPAAIMRALRERNEKVDRQREEIRFKTLLENSNDCFILVQEDTSVIYASPSIEKILGYTPEEFKSKSILSYFPPNEVTQRMDKLKLLLSGKEESVEDETKIRTKKGEYIWISAFLTDQREIENIEAVVINFHDIDHKKKIEQRVRHNELKFKSLVQEGSDLISILSEEGEYIFVSSNFKRVLGYPSDELIGKRPIDLIHPEDAFRVLQELEKIRKKRRVKPKPFRLKDSKGQYRWLESIFTNKLDEEAIGGIIVNSRDVTSLIKRTEELTVSLERYYYALKAANDHIYEWNLETNQAYRIGDSLKSIFGYSNKEGEEPGFWEKKIHPNERDKVYKELRESFKDSKISMHTSQYRFLKANGTYAYVRDIAYILRDKNERAIRLIGAITDVTTWRNLEFHTEQLSKLTEVIHDKGSLKHRLTKASRLLMDFTQTEVVEIWLVDIDKTRMQRVAHSERDRASRAFSKESENITFKKGEGTPGKVWETGRTYRIHSLESEKNFKRKILAESNKLNTGICIPIRSQNEIIGTVLALSSPEVHYIDEHMDALESIIRDFAPYLQRAKLEEELNRFFDVSPDILSIAGLDGYFKKINPTMCRILGYSEDEILKTPIQDWLHPEDIDTTNAELAALGTGQTTFNFRNRYKTKSGQYTWLEWTSKALPDEGLIYAVARDITEQVELEQLHEKSQRLAKVGSWNINLQTEEITWSSIAREIYEVDEDFKPTVLNVIEFFHEVELELLKKLYDKSIGTGEQWDIEIPLITQKGNKKWSRITGNAEFVDGMCARLYGSIQDIHDRKSAEMEKVTILESITDGFIGLDRKWKITHWNHAVEELFSTTKRNAVGAPIWEVIKVDEADTLKVEFLKASKKQKVTEFEYYYDPEEVWLNISVFPKLDGLTVYIRDITEKRNMQRQLIHAITQTQEKERAVFGRELHDGITQYLAASRMSLTQFKTLLEKGKVRMDVLDKVLKYLAETTEESRNISHGLLSTTLQNRGLKQAILEIAKNLSEVTKIKMECDCDDLEDGKMSKDLQLNIYRIIQELTNNATKYSKATSAWLSCHVKGGRLYLEMKDDGIGIPELHSGDYQKGAGIRNITIRTETMNGTFRMENDKPHGLISRIEIPIVQNKIAESVLE